MNEFTAKKLGEVLAFSIIGNEIVTRGKEAFTSVFKESGTNNVLEATKEQAEEIKKIAERENVKDIALKKSEKTSEKLRKMAELYIGDDWDDSTELLEWHGFFEGAALVHWQLVAGAAEAEGNEKLKQLAKKGIKFHSDFLDLISKELNEIGEEKAKH